MAKRSVPSVTLGYHCNVSFNQVFALDLPIGYCVGMRLAAAPGERLRNVAKMLPAAEISFAEDLAPPRRRSWLGGRIALRAALSHLGLHPGPMLSQEDGAPTLPAGVSASISHDHQTAVAVACRTERRRAKGSGGPALSVGIDVEQRRPERPRIAGGVLTQNEQHAVLAMPPGRRWEETLRRFSLKEAVYKAAAPWLGRDLGFQEVAVWPNADGSARVEFEAGLPSGLQTEAWWMILGDQVLTYARVTTTA